ncbi:MAG: DNA-binding protein WhiA [Bacillota bacterium]|jgi:DNA-binding protein WhiA
MNRDTFSRSVKEELSRVRVNGRSQSLVEALALRRQLSSGHHQTGEAPITAEPFVIRRLYYLVKEGSGLSPSLRTRVPSDKSRSGRRRVSVDTDMKQVELPVQDLLRQSSSCRRAYLRGAFLARGSIASPNRGYHLEIVFATRQDAMLAQSLMRREGLRSGIVQRRSAFVIYMKDGDQISEFLKQLGANQAVLRYENVRAAKSLKNSVQRIVNMDRANVSRSVEASLRHIRDIQLIDREKGLSHLPRALRELARTKLDNPDLSMEELGQLLTPPISKSAVNHRLRRLATLAQDIRAQKARR